LSVVSIHKDGSNGWTFDGTSGSDSVDSIEGFKNFKEIYEKSDENYFEGYSVPALWDTKKKTIVSNDSVQIIRILSTAFDQFLTPDLRETNKPGGGLRPEVLEDEIDALGDDIESDINWGTYKCGMAGSQADYDESMKRLFGRFDVLEEKLAVNKYLLGDNITEPDIR
jgi:putative glutathione S-transferase